MNRRGFLAGILAAGAAPAIVRAQTLMRLAPAPRIWMPENELGRVEGIRFITSPVAPAGDVLTLEKLRRAVRTLKRQAATPIEGYYLIWPDEGLYQQLRG